MRFGDSFIVKPALEFTIPRVTVLVYVLRLIILGEIFKEDWCAHFCTICERHIFYVTVASRSHSGNVKASTIREEEHTEQISDGASANRIARRLNDHG